MEHAELIETAGVNYLAGLKWPAGFTKAQISPGQSATDIAAALISVSVEGDLGPEYPLFSGNRWADVKIELKTPVATQTPDQVAAGAQTPLALHSLVAAALQDAVMDSNLPALLTAAVAGFTAFGVIDRCPIREQTENYWLSGWRFRLLSCPSAFPN